MRKAQRLGILLTLAIGITVCRASDPVVTIKELKWDEVVAKTVRAMGDGNWIVVADSSFPSLSDDGIQTVVADRALLGVLERVFKEIDSAGHVRGTAMLTEELNNIPERDAPAIAKHRKKLGDVLKNRDISRALDAELLKKMREVAGDFKVLVVKTKMKIPYTAVYVELERSYWNEEREKRLRNAMRDAE